MKRLGRALLRWAVRAGWAVMALAAVLALAESLGLWAWGARRWIASTLNRPIEEVRIDMLQLSWLRPRLELKGVEVGPEGATVRVDAATLDFDLLGPGSPRLVRAKIEGGGFDLSRRLLVAWQGVSDATQAVNPATVLLPEVELRGIEIALRSESIGRVPLGALHVLLRAGDDGRPQLWGRLDPSGALGGGSSGAAVFLRGELQSDQAFEVRATATALRLRSEELPDAQAFAAIKAAAPQVRLDLDLRGRVPLKQGEEPQVKLGLRLAGGSISLLDGRETLKDLALDLRADWHPQVETEWTELRSLDLEAAYSGTTRLGAVRGGMVCGVHAGSEQAAAWLVGDRFEIGEPLKQLLAGDLFALRQWSAFEPRGTAKLRAAWRVPHGGALADAHVAADLELQGETAVTFRGWPSGAMGALDEGFPLAIEQLHGRVVFHHDSKAARTLRVGIVGAEMLSRHESGLINLHARGDVRTHAPDASPFAPGRGNPEWDVRIEADALPFDATTEAALRGLSSAVPVNSWLPYHPRGGTIDAKVRVGRTVESTTTMVSAELQLRDMQARWDELPLPLSKVNGPLVFRSDGLGMRGLTFALEAVAEGGSTVDVRGRLQTEDYGDARTVQETDDVQHIWARAPAVVLEGADAAVLAASLDDVRAAMDELQPRGTAQLEWSRTRDGRAAVRTTRAIVEPATGAAKLVLTPRAFPMDVEVLAGTGVVEAREGVPSTVRVGPVLGRVQEAWVCARVALPERDLELRAAGVDTKDPRVWECLAQAWDAAAGAQTVQFTGQVDLTGQMRLGASANTTQWQVALRGNGLRSGSFALREVGGLLELQGGVVSGTNLTTTLGDTPIAIQDLRWDLVSAAPLEARFAIESLPLDRVHLGAFLAADNLDALLDGLELRGAVQVPDGRVLWQRDSGEPGASGRVELSGNARPRGVALRVGMPINISDARLQVERLSFDAGGTKALVRIEDLRGQLADRSIERTRLLLSYVGDQLSIDEWDGAIEGGRLRGLGTDNRRATVLGIALRKPYPFQLALQLEEVEVEGMLRGLFTGRGGTKGLFNAQLSLSGELDRLLSIRGTGRLAVSESRLWGIPVFRELLGQLGLDAGVVFDSLSTNVRLEAGVIHMEDLRVQSPLLQLSGAGELDFDGSLQYELGLTYGLVDRLGAVTQALYWLQNKLLTVTIGGDMMQPVVRVQNPLGALLRAEVRRALPRPGLSGMPSKF